MSFAQPGGLYHKGRGKEAPLLAAPDNTPIPRPPRRPRAIDLVLRGRIGRADGAVLCERVRVLLDGSRLRQVVCDVGALMGADLGTVEALAKLQLTARHLGASVCLRQASLELQELLVLVGLRNFLPCQAGLRLEASGQTEDREEPRGIEEEGDSADPAG